MSRKIVIGVGVFFLLLLLTLGALVAGLWWAFSPIVSPNSVSDVESVEQKIVIAKGRTTSQVATQLVEANLIRHPMIFLLAVKYLKLDGRLQAGSFTLSPTQPLFEIAQALTKSIDDLWVTIPEGLRREEIASLFAADLPEFDKVEFLSLAKDAEGRLFPDTYLIPNQATAGFIFSLLSNTFDKRVATGLAEEIASSSHSLDELLIMASLLEREAKSYEDMQHVAGILWNRIELGMPLQVDATLQYAKGQTADGKWWNPPLGVDRQLASPFNTYQNPGLPPAPIANPGLDAIRAALNPLATSDLFYLHDSSGQMWYAPDYAGHQQNINRYLR